MVYFDEQNSAIVIKSKVSISDYILAIFVSCWKQIIQSTFFSIRFIILTFTLDL